MRVEIDAQKSVLGGSVTKKRLGSCLNQQNYGILKNENLPQFLNRKFKFRDDNSHNIDSFIYLILLTNFLWKKK